MSNGVGIIHTPDECSGASWPCSDLGERRSTPTAKSDLQKDLAKKAANSTCGNNPAQTSWRRR
jgi:hypothetical protein